MSLARMAVVSLFAVGATEDTVSDAAKEGPEGAYLEVLEHSGLSDATETRVTISAEATDVDNLMDGHEMTTMLAREGDELFMNYLKEDAVLDFIANIPFLLFIIIKGLPTCQRWLLNKG